MSIISRSVEYSILSNTIEVILSNAKNLISANTDPSWSLRMAHRSTSDDFSPSLRVIPHSWSYTDPHKAGRVRNGSALCRLVILAVGK